MWAFYRIPSKKIKWFSLGYEFIACTQLINTLMSTAALPVGYSADTRSFSGKKALL
jgi:hypothetical protein